MGEMDDANSIKQLLQVINGLKVHQSEDQLVIGLDFGTTFSGVAYAFANEKNPDLVSIMDWPGKPPRLDRKNGSR
jgi:hypothetical protein